MPALQTAVPGWNITVAWGPEQRIIPLFIPDNQYTPENVDAAARAAGAKSDEIHALGS